MSDLFPPQKPRILIRHVPARGEALTDAQLTERLRGLTDPVLAAVRQIFWEHYADCEYALTDPALPDKQHHFAQGGLNHLTAVLDRIETLRGEGGEDDA